MSDAQRAAKDAFHGVLADDLDAVREACGAELTLTTDFEHYDRAAWTGERGADAPGQAVEAPSRRMILSVAVACKKTVHAIYSICRLNAKKETWKPVIAREVKGVRCLFSGVQARRPGESSVVVTRRNLSFESGQLTVRMSPDLPDVAEVPALVLMAGLADKSGAPTVRKDILRTGDNGERCSSESDCGSRLCVSSVCTACGRRAACQHGMRCDEGTCRTPQELSAIAAQRQNNARADRAPASTPREPAGKGLGLGKMCRSTAECRSGLSCKRVSASMSTCR